MLADLGRRLCGATCSCNNPLSAIRSGAASVNHHGLVRMSSPSPGRFPQDMVLDEAVLKHSSQARWWGFGLRGWS